MCVNPNGRTLRERRSISFWLKNEIAMQTIDTHNRIGYETIEARLHADRIGSHQAELNPVALPDILGQVERQLQHIEAVAGRPENAERPRLSANRSVARDRTHRRIEIASRISERHP